MDGCENYLSIARKIFEGTKYEPSEEDIERLANNITIVAERGLDKLNRRLINSKGRGIWNTLAEHNFAVILLSKHSAKTPIFYEPLELQCPPDFKVELENITFWIQMKDLSKLERENRQDKIIQKIKSSAEKIKVGKFFSCKLSDGFHENCLPKLINFIEAKATTATEEKKLFFTDENNQKAEIEFWSARNITLSELTLGFSGDLDMVEISGLSKEQIKRSILNATRAFNWDVDQKTVNLIAMEADQKEDIDICDALFGTEGEIISRNSWTRKDDGLFRQPDFSKKVAGVIAIKRKREIDIKVASLSSEEVGNRLSEKETEFAKTCGMTPEEIKEAYELKYPGPVANYNQTLYINHAFKLLLPDIKKILNFDKIVYYNTRPTMEKGNFE